MSLPTTTCTASRRTYFSTSYSNVSWLPSVLPFSPKANWIYWHSARWFIASTRESFRFARRRECQIHVSGGEFNVAANLADCFALNTGIATAMVDYPIGDLIAERVRAMGVRPFYKRFHARRRQRAEHRHGI